MPWSQIGPLTHATNIPCSTTGTTASVATAVSLTVTLPSAEKKEASKQGEELLGSSQGLVPVTSVFDDSSGVVVGGGSEVMEPSGAEGNVSRCIEVRVVKHYPGQWLETEHSGRQRLKRFTHTSAPNHAH